MITSASSVICVSCESSFISSARAEISSSPCSSLLNCLNRPSFSSNSKSCCSPRVDTKGSGDLVSRLGVRRPADLLVPPDMDLVEAVRAASSEGRPLACVLCDESQFLTAEQAEQLFMVTVELNIPVICYGLRSDFSLKGFPGSTRLLELAHTIEEMKTICTCGRKATCNCRKVNGRFVFEGEQVAIDLENDVQYVSMCPQCYFRERSAFYAARR